MSRISKLAGSCAVLAAGLLFPAAASAEEEPPAVPQLVPSATVGAETDFQSRYLWRGLALSRGPVSQSSVWITSRDFTLSFWGSSSQGGTARSHAFDEIDYTLSYERQQGKLTIEPSILHYSYPNPRSGAATTEAAVKLSYPLGPVSLFTDHALDIARYRGAYFGQIGVSFERELTSNLSLEATLAAGWGSRRFNEANFGAARSTLGAATGDLAITWAHRKGYYVRPHVSVSSLLDGRLRRRVKEPGLVSFGVAVGAEF